MDFLIWLEYKFFKRYYNRIYIFLTAYHFIFALLT